MFNANGGKITGLGTKITTIEVVPGKTYGEGSAAFPKADKADNDNSADNNLIFCGWFTEKDIKGGVEITKYTVVDETAAGLVLYARWAQAETLPYESKY